MQYSHWGGQSEKGLWRLSLQGSFQYAVAVCRNFVSKLKKSKFILPAATRNCLLPFLNLELSNLELLNLVPTATGHCQLSFLNFEPWTSCFCPLPLRTTNLNFELWTLNLELWTFVPTRHTYKKQPQGLPRGQFIKPFFFIAGFLTDSHKPSRLSHTYFSKVSKSVVPSLSSSSSINWMVSEENEIIYQSSESSLKVSGEAKKILNSISSSSSS